ncbi:MAG: site-specific integrase [Deltaproteobacteria bacterium]|nr:site-specific integrase [Deltaproteobacteria bacterium]
MAQKKSRNHAATQGNMGELVRAFFDWLVAERNASPNTIHAYRDTVVLFMRHLADASGKRVEQLSLENGMHEQVLGFLNRLETERRVSITTRNHRLSALKSFFRFAAYRDPLLASHCRSVTLIPLKKHEARLLDYLEAQEMEAIIAQPDRSTRDGRRDYAALLLLYNTGCRASELVAIRRDDLCFESPRHVRILGKGRRWRIVPLWAKSVEAIEAVLRERSGDNPFLFVGQRGNPLTRAGLRYMIEKYTGKAAEKTPSLKKHRVTPHTVRHTTAVALLRATRDIDATAKILGHASLNTTKVYTDKDRSRLAETLGKVSTTLLGSESAEWQPSNDLLDWLESL